MFNFKDAVHKISSNTKLKRYAVIGIVGIILMIAASTIFEVEKREDDPGPKEDNGNQIGISRSGDDEHRAEKSLEGDLERLLGNIENAGKVTVLITYENNGVIHTEKNVDLKESQVTEKDANGGERNTSEKDQSSEVVYTENGSNKDPFIVSQTSPKIRGVAVIAEGGNDEVVVGKITRTLEVLLDLPVHKIQVTR